MSRFRSKNSSVYRTRIPILALFPAPAAPQILGLLQALTGISRDKIKSIEQRNMIRRFGTIILLAAIAFVTSSCHKGFCPDLSDKLLIEFAPGAENATTKAASAPGAGFDFGVWGIARYKTSNVPDYLLWDATSMTEVKQVQNGNSLSYSYIPVTDAFWFRDYTYDFIAVAPWAAADGLTVTPGESSGSDILTFDFDLAEKYSPTQPTDPDAAPVVPDYDFDLMAAVGHSFVETTATHPTQDLTFWHLLSRININVAFKGPNNTTVAGSVQELRLSNVDHDINYTVSFNDGLIDIDYSNTEVNSTVNPIVSTPSGLNWILHIVPQNISNFNLEIDYTYGEGDNALIYKNIDINLNPTGTSPTDYKHNETYNWNITIGEKKQISFKATVAQWTDVNVPDGDDDEDNDYVEII